MFWRNKPKSPITIEDQEWIENQLSWIDANVIKLVDQPTILPIKKFFEKSFTGEETDAKYVLKKVGEYCRIQTSNINLKFYSEEAIELDRGTITQQEEGSGSAGLYVQDGDKFSIWIEIQQLKDPHLLIATVAHEISHYALLGIKEFSLEGEENEWLTDLLSIAFGFGIFIGNSMFNFSQWQSGDGWGGWQTSSQGYLPQQITAYAMANIESRRSDELPSWVTYMKPDLQSDFKKSMNYLLKAKSK